MIRAAAAAMILLVLGGGADGQRGGRGAPPPAPPTFRGAISVHEEVIVRMPRASRQVRGPSSDPRVQWTEHHGPRCIEAGQIAGAALLGADSVDLVLRDRTRIRVRLENGCPALDYYRGFYVSTAGDGRICADRDVVRSRAGAACQIEAFRLLRPSRR